MAIVVTVVGFAILWAWPRLQKRLGGPARFVPAAVIVVVAGTLVAHVAGNAAAAEMLTSDHLVSIPVIASPADLLGAVVLPDFSRITDPLVWKTAATLAVVASIESLLRGGRYQLVPFLVTLVTVVTTDLLTGTIVGVIVGVVFVLHRDQRQSVQVTRDGNHVLVRFLKDVTFLNKAALKGAFANIPPGSHVIVDGTRARFVDEDIAEVVVDFEHGAAARHITVELRKSSSAGHPLFRAATPAKRTDDDHGTKIEEERAA